MAAPKGNKNAEGNEGGRPTKYKPEYAELAYKFCLLGAIDEELAVFFEVHVDTIAEWKNTIIEFSEAIRAGKAVADIEVASELYKGAKDRVVIEQMAFKVKDVIFDEVTGRKIKEIERIELVDVEKIVPADFRNQQFWLKNRQKDKWREKQTIEHEGIPETAPPDIIVYNTAPPMAASEDEIEDKKE